MIGIGWKGCMTMSCESFFRRDILLPWLLSSWPGVVLGVAKLDATVLAGGAPPAQRSCGIPRNRSRRPLRWA